MTDAESPESPESPAERPYSPAFRNHVTPTSKTRGRRILLIGVGLAVLVGLVVALIGSNRLVYTDGTRPGTLSEGGSPSFTDEDAHKAVVQLPLGGLTVAVGKPSQDPPDGGVEEKKAADGASWVPVEWQVNDKSQGIDFNNNVPAFQYSVVLVADGRRYDLQAGISDDEPASNYVPIVLGKSVDVVVQGPAKDLKVEVGYDGVTQTLDVDSGKIDKGLAAPLYRADDASMLLDQTTCSILSKAARRTYELSSADHCRVGAVRALPYVGTVGWVDSARETWLVVPMDISGNEIDRIRGDRYHSSYDLRDIDYAVTVDGTKPTTEILRYYTTGFAPQHLGVLLIKTSADTQTLTLRLTARATNRIDSSKKRTFTSTQTYSLR